MNYFETILKSLMYYPSIMGNEFDVQHHLFVVNGNGYEWNEKGQLECFSSRKRAPARSFDSVTGNFQSDLEERKQTKRAIKRGQRPCFSGVGLNFTKLYPYCQYACLEDVITGKVVPEATWAEGIEDFARTIGRWDEKTYELYLDFYERLHYPGGRNQSAEQMAQTRSYELENFRVVQAKCLEILPLVSELANGVVRFHYHR